MAQPPTRFTRSHMRKAQRRLPSCTLHNKAGLTMHTLSPCCFHLACWSHRPAPTQAKHTQAEGTLPDSSHRQPPILQMPYRYEGQNTLEQSRNTAKNTGAQTQLPYAASEPAQCTVCFNIQSRLSSPPSQPGMIEISDLTRLTAPPTHCHT